jgi:hypothetical protein
MTQAITKKQLTAWGKIAAWAIGVIFTICGAVWGTALVMAAKETRIDKIEETSKATAVWVQEAEKEKKTWGITVPGLKEEVIGLRTDVKALSVEVNKLTTAIVVREKLSEQFWTVDWPELTRRVGKLEEK